MNEQNIFDIKYINKEQIILILDIYKTEAFVKLLYKQ